MGSAYTGPMSDNHSPPGPDRVTVIAMIIVAFLGAACLAWAASLTAG